jgi:hypothetical protein
MNGYILNNLKSKQHMLITSVLCLASFSTFAQQSCEEKSVRLLNNWGDRHQFSFTPSAHEESSFEVESACVSLTDLETELTATTQRGATISVNGNAFVNGPVIVKNGDTVTLKTVTPHRAGISTTERLILSNPESSEHWYYPWTLSTVEQTAFQAPEQACFVADFTFDDYRQRLNVFELPANKYHEPGEVATSQCIEVTNLPVPVTATMQRAGEFSINYGEYSSEPRVINNGDIISLRSNTPSVSGDVLLDRLTLQQELESGSISTTYYQWFVGNKSNDSYTQLSDCYVLDKANSNSGILPHTVTSNESSQAVSQCVVNAEPDSVLKLTPQQRHVKVLVNDNLVEEEIIELHYGDVAEVVYDFTTPGFSYSWFTLKTTWDEFDSRTTEVKWVVENNITEYDNTSPSNGGTASYEVTDAMFETCRPSSFHLRVNDLRNFDASALPASIYQPINSELYSQCIVFEGLETTMTLHSHDNSWFSVNGQPFTQQESEVANGDKVVIATTTPNGYNQTKSVRAAVVPGAEAIDSNVFYLNWAIQTENTARLPKTWRIGPSQSHRQIEEIASLLVAGDTVEVIGDADYEPFILTNVSGTPELPIKIVGVTVNGKKPRFIGNHNDWKWTIGLRNSHSIELSNLEVTGGEYICIRHESDNITIRDSFIHNCPHIGIMGTDAGSGSISIYDTEVTNAGGLPDPTAKWGHPIYIATDQFRFPGSVLRIERAFLHNNKGNSIKSRAERTELYYNWIEVSDIEQSRYAIELIGPGMGTVNVTNQDVVGNTIVMNKDFAVARFGNDGSGGSNGRVRFANNLVLLNADTYNTYLFNLTFALTSFTLQNNLVHSTNSDVNVSYLMRDDIVLSQWNYGEVNVFVENNTFTNAMGIKSASLTNTVGNTSETILGETRWSNNAYARDTIATTTNNGLVEQVWGFQQNTMPYLLDIAPHLQFEDYLAEAPVASMLLTRPVEGEQQ